MTISRVFFRPLLVAALGLLGPIAAHSVAAESFPWKSYASKPDAWYRGPAGIEAAENVLSHRAEAGDWPKNLDTSKQRFTGDRAKIQGTFDNGATVGETRFLARAFRATGEPRYRDAADRSLGHILSAQYPTGGWPQSFPPGHGYARYITFNDNTTVNLLTLLRDVARAEPDFAFVAPSRREASKKAFDAGIRCILACQVKADGRLTVWCAQHDEKTLEPRGARTFELPSLSGSESAGILLLLMDLDDPSPEVVRAVRSGVAWFEASTLTGLRLVVADGDRKVVPDPAAPPLWARFYEIDTNRPFFCGRDGVKKYTLAEIERERRAGYAWYGAWGSRVLARYATWKDREVENDKPGRVRPQDAQDRRSAHKWDGIGSSNSKFERDMLVSSGVSRIRVLKSD
jgi:PelA/Pel-15E family pectate lyase